MLQVSALRCERDRRELFSDVSFSIRAGELLQIVGANGSGKSTLLRILTGVFTDYEGDLTTSLEAPPLYFGHKTGVKTQLTVRENIHAMLAIRRVTCSREEIDSVLQQLALWGYDDTVCDQLSEGQKKRVGLARFFLCKDSLWIMDEPFSAIDQAGLAALKTLISGHAESGGAVIFSTHQKLQFEQTLKTLEL